MSQSWSLIVLCYNEEGNLKVVLDDVFHTLDEMKVTDYEVIIVNDGSTDGSANVIQELQKTYPQVILKNHETFPI